jgi:hypothetical protein
MLGFGFNDGRFHDPRETQHGAISMRTTTSAGRLTSNPTRKFKAADADAHSGNMT